MTNTHLRNLLTLLSALIVASADPLNATPIPKNLLGDWSLDLETGEPAWMSITQEEGTPVVYMRVHVGPEGPYDITEVADGRIKFSLKPKRKAKGSDTYIQQHVEVGFTDSKLNGTLIRSLKDGSESEETSFTGNPIPPMPESAPDLSQVRFGHPISLFNGKDLTGWRTYETDKINGWSVIDGMLVNTTTKTDFSPTGAYANLQTEAEFEDFWLHIEFLIEADRNSGVYLRGMYEAQVVDRDSRMQGLQGVGAIFSRIAPSENAGRPPGEWQTYDITLVDRHVTVVLNGVKVIDNQPVIGPTGGAIRTDPMAPGPIYLQGDHTSVKFKNIYLAPVTDD
ncbi:MAG: DUF1080 domain-containing protein [Verrucomicrobiales bacterium]|nr:DUF1080 domain-containing protein [Verrucomicrobiales bacterium]